MTKVREEALPWRPDWSDDDRAEIERLKTELRSVTPIVRRLRRELALSQSEVAAILETTQSNVSKIEAKQDPTLSVLRRLIESQGGKLEVRGILPDGREIELS